MDFRCHYDVRMTQIILILYSKINLKKKKIESYLSSWSYRKRKKEKKKVQVDIVISRKSYKAKVEEIK